MQNRAQLGSSGAAVSAIRATLETLGERLAGGEAEDLAAQLPREVGYYLTVRNGKGERFDLDEFFERVGERENTDLPVAAYHARVVMEVVQEATAQSNQPRVTPPVCAAVHASRFTFHTD